MKKTLYLILFIVGIYFLYPTSVSAVTEDQVCDYFNSKHGMSNIGECAVDVEVAYDYYIDNLFFKDHRGSGIDIDDTLNPSSAPEYLTDTGGYGVTIFSEVGGLSSYNLLAYSMNTEAEFIKAGGNIVGILNHLDNLANSWNASASDILDGISDEPTESDQYDKAKRFADIAAYYAQAAQNLYNDSKAYATMVLYYDSIGYDSINNQAFDPMANLKSKLDATAEAAGVTVSKIGSCMDIIGADLRDQLQRIFDYIKIIVPTLLIVLSSLDLAKTMASSDEKKVAAAKQSFGIRLFAALGIFFLPALLNLILDLAGVGAGTCGIG